MEIVLGTIAFAALAAILVFARGQNRQPVRRSPSSSERQAGADDFQGIEIVAARGACEAARNVEGQRFLSRNAPRLPLPDCTSSRCDCTFRKLGDRRADIRRWSDYGVETALFAGDEQRARDTDRRT